ncbi:lysophosphatidylserine lipase ABHD12-like [Saccoglossus kowalevskii]|uniref:Monoacylglycerol lipase ABHD12-like n=1 Tax=Saccoglossus kowalevskii TaxID=10224 RepID=A0ABM0LX90_SACKO|nr:PREDICTED: monoacylglycerol lipase ABHD12-like [Saccoglossus kowalevskii]
MRSRSTAKTTNAGGENKNAQTVTGKEKKMAKGKPRRHTRSFLGTLLKVLKYFILFVFVFYLSFPFLLNIFPVVPRELTFLSKVRWPYFVDFNHPENYNVTGGRNIHIKSTDDVTLGIWQILPKSLLESSQEKTSEYYEKALSDGKHVILYFHGNSGNRARDHRVELYNVLSGINYHIIAFDYRGYGDSNGTSNAVGILQDAEVMYKWLKPRIGKAKLYLYGHSLGTAVATALSRELCDAGECPSGLILESPFTDLIDEARNHPLSRFWKFWPGFDQMFLNAFLESAIPFNSTENIDYVKCKILIMHAKDDLVVPFILGEKLAQHAGKNRPAGAGALKFLAFRADKGYGHKHLVRATELPKIISDFIENARDEGQPANTKP